MFGKDRDFLYHCNLYRGTDDFMRRFILLLCMAVCLCACDHDERMAKDRQVVLLYLAGNNTLDTEGIGENEDIKRSWLPTTRGSD